jgi:hypothetical protein
MMDQFKKVYRFGGMGLDHSAWWLAKVDYNAYGVEYRYIKRLAKSDYT